MSSINDFLPNKRITSQPYDKEIKSIRAKSESEAINLCFLINNLNSISVTRNTNFDGYWIESPNHAAGIGAKWYKETIKPNAEYKKFDGEFLVYFHEVFYEKAISLA